MHFMIAEKSSDVKVQRVSRIHWTFAPKTPEISRSEHEGDEVGLGVHENRATSLAKKNSLRTTQHCPHHMHNEQSQSATTLNRNQYNQNTAWNPNSPIMPKCAHNFLLNYPLMTLAIRRKHPISNGVSK